MTRTSRIKFNHVFTLLMLLSAAGAFAIPTKYTAKAQPQVQGLFTPVAAPVRSAAAWVNARVVKPQPADPRDREVITAENEFLRTENAALQHELAAAKRLIDERGDVGLLLRDKCTPVAVVSPDAGSRESLQVRGSTLEGIKQDQPALYGNSVAGRIERPPGLLGAQVRLVTDRGMRIGAYFGRYETDPETGKLHWRRLETSAVLVEGVGGGAMRCATALTLEELRKEKVNLHPGDWVLLEDGDWDERVHGRLLGRVVRVAPQNAAPLYADIRIEPTKNLSRLREVMVLTK